MIELLCDDSTGCKEVSNNDDYHRSRQRQTFNLNVLFLIIVSFDHLNKQEYLLYRLVYM